MTLLKISASEAPDSVSPELSVRAELPDNYPRQLVTYLAGSASGRVIIEALRDDDVTEVYVNSDKKLWKETYSAGPVFTGCEMGSDFATMFLNAVATRHGLTLDREHPAIAAELPDAFFNRARLQGEVPPLVAHPSFNIRKPPPRTFTLDELVEQGVLSVDQRSVIRYAVLSRCNVVIAGNMNSGKTTFARSVLKEIAELCPRDRLLILEDTPELRSESPNTHLMRKPEGWELTPLVTIALRKNAKRICVSEVRDREALALLDAWTTHRGGLATMHADSVEKCLDRLDRLAMRNRVPSDRVLIAQAVQLVVLLEGDNEGRRVAEMVYLAEQPDRNAPYALRRFNDSDDLR